MIIRIRPIPASLGQASGDVIYYNGSAWARLAKGSDGQVLKLAAGLPCWAADADTVYNDANVFYKDGSRNLTGVLVTSGQGIRPAANSTTAIQFQQADGTVISNFDTTNKRQGWGTIAPAVQVHSAESIITSPRGIMSSQHSDGVDGARFHLRKSRGTNAAPSVITTGDMLGRLIASGYDGTNYLEMAGIDFVSAGTIGTNRVPSEIRFLTATDAAPSVLTQQAVITKAGKLGVGNSTPNSILDVLSAVAVTGNRIASFKNTFEYTYVYVDGTTASGFELAESGTAKWQVKSSGSNMVFRDFARIDAFVLQDNTGYVGLSTTPTKDLSFLGTSARTIWLERHTTAATAGNDLSIYAGGPKAGETNQPGGTLNLYGGICTGNKEGGVKIYGYVAGASGSDDCSPSVILQVLGNKFAIFGGTAVVQQSHIADASGGSVVDVEARAAVNAVLAALENYGWLKAS